MTRVSDSARALLAPPRAGAESDALVGSSLAAILVGASYPNARNPLATDARDHLRVSGVGGISSSILLAYLLGSAGADSDLDALDIGPAHLALPATAAAISAAASSGNGDVSSAVVFGCTVGARMRATCAAAGPGIRMHSVSSFGLVAAVCAAGAALGLDGAQMRSALCIALDRAAGFAVNNNSTDIGITHFGWSAAHGVESAWLASEAASASSNLDAALENVFGEDVRSTDVDLAQIDPHGRTVYKSYPVNVYLNQLFAELRGRRIDAGTRVRVVIPSIPRLALEQPVTPRELRNSVRGVVALALSQEHSFESFTAESIEDNGPAIEELIRRTEVVLDPSRPTDLTTATLDVIFIDDDGVEAGHEVAVARPGMWDATSLEVLFDSPASQVDAPTLHALTQTPDADRIDALVAHLLESDTRTAHRKGISKR